MTPKDKLEFLLELMVHVWEAEIRGVDCGMTIDVDICVCKKTQLACDFDTCPIIKEWCIT